MIDPFEEFIKSLDAVDGINEGHHRPEITVPTRGTTIAYYMENTKEKGIISSLLYEGAQLAQVAPHLPQVKRIGKVEGLVLDLDTLASENREQLEFTGFRPDVQVTELAGTKLYTLKEDFKLNEINKFIKMLEGVALNMQKRYKK